MALDPLRPGAKGAQPLQKETPTSSTAGTEPAANTVPPNRSADGFASARPAANLVPAAKPDILRGPGIGNGFRMELSGRNPPVPAGSWLTQIKQGIATSRFAADAMASVGSGGYTPSDFSVAAKLRSLGTMPAVEDPSKISLAAYTSQMAGVSPDKAYDFFVKNFSAVFGAGDLKIRPPINALKDGARVMLENGGPPPMWFPIEVHLDPAKRQIHIVTLDGHPLRGTNDFTFADDGQGGTRVEQRSRFQGSSPLTSVGVDLMGALNRQHVTWEKVHAFLFNQLGKGN